MDSRNKLSTTLLALGVAALVGCGGSGGGGSSSTAAGVNSGTSATPTTISNTNSGTIAGVLSLGLVAPTSGPLAGATEITLRGDGFVAGTEVMINGQPAVDVRFVDAQTILARTPASTQAGDVEVLVRRPTGNVARLASGFRYLFAQRVGMLDTTFGGQGFVVEDYQAPGSTSGTDLLRGAAVDAQGRLVVVGESTRTNTGFNYDLMVKRYNEDGTLDSTFGVGGLFVHEGAAGDPAGWDSASAVTFDAQGNLIVVGRGHNLARNADLVVYRITPAGALDPTFGGQGFVVSSDSAGGAGWDNGQAVVVDDQGRIVVAGYSALATPGATLTTKRVLAVWRFLPTGQADLTFGRDGFVSYDSGARNSDEARGVAIDSTGRIVVAGHVGSGPSGSRDVAVIRLFENGTPDPTFATGGVWTHDNAAGGTGSEFGYALALDEQDRIHVTASSAAVVGRNDAVVYRLTPQGTLDPSFGSGGLVVLPDGNGIAGSDDSPRALAYDAYSQKIVVIGQTRDATRSMDATVWQINLDGTLDTAFGTGGVFQHNRTSNTGVSGLDQAHAGAVDTQGRIVIAGYSRISGGTSDHVVYRVR